MELVELFDILLLKYINAAGTLCNPQATYLNIFPLLICTYMYRDNFPQQRKGYGVCFQHVHLLVQLKGIAPWELRRELSGWAVDGCEPAEARGSWVQAKWCFWGTRPSLCPPGPQEVQGSADPGCSADFSLLRMVFGLLPICWLFGLICHVLGRLHSSVVCWRLWGPHLLRCETTP